MENKKSSNKVVIIIVISIVVMVLILIGAIAYLLVNSLEQESSPESQVTETENSQSSEEPVIGFETKQLNDFESMYNKNNVSLDVDTYNVEYSAQDADENEISLYVDLDRQQEKEDDYGYIISYSKSDSNYDLIEEYELYTSGYEDDYEMVFAIEKDGVATEYSGEKAIAEFENIKSSETYKALENLKLVPSDISSNVETLEFITHFESLNKGLVFSYLEEMDSENVISSERGVLETDSFNLEFDDEYDIFDYYFQTNKDVTIGTATYNDLYITGSIY